MFTLAGNLSGLENYDSNGADGVADHGMLLEAVVSRIIVLDLVEAYLSMT